MKIGDQDYEQIVVALNGEVMAVISDNEIIEKEGVKVIMS